MTRLPLLIVIISKFLLLTFINKMIDYSIYFPKTKKIK